MLIQGSAQVVCSEVVCELGQGCFLHREASDVMKTGWQHCCLVRTTVVTFAASLSVLKFSVTCTHFFLIYIRTKWHKSISCFELGKERSPQSVITAFLKVTLNEAARIATGKKLCRAQPYFHCDLSQYAVTELLTEQHSCYQIFSKRLDFLQQALLVKHTWISPVNQ